MSSVPRINAACSDTTFQKNGSTKNFVKYAQRFEYTLERYNIVSNARKSAAFHVYLIYFAELLEQVFSCTFNVNREISLDKQWNGNAIDSSRSANKCTNK